jgi:hypothetical protein
MKEERRKFGAEAAATGAANETEKRVERINRNNEYRKQALDEREQKKKEADTLDADRNGRLDDFRI